MATSFKQQQVAAYWPGMETANLGYDEINPRWWDYHWGAAPPGGTIPVPQADTAREFGMDCAESQTHT
jgi:hypothetical protein